MSLGAAAADMVASDRPEEIVVTGFRTNDLDRPAAIGKTDVPLKDVPRSIQIIPRALIESQGAVNLQDTLRDVSGAGQGGQFAFGFYDRFVIRGLNVFYLNDGLPDQTSELTGFVHPLVGVQRVEVLKGPGSALYGDAQEGGTINLVHFRPADEASGEITEQVGSFGTTVTDVAVTGPTGIADLDWRLDGEFQHSDGFRGLFSESLAVLPALSWRPTNHDVEWRAEYYHLENLPDATGLPFATPKGTGYPLGVAPTTTYETPYAYADQDIARVFLSDAWTAAPGLIVNNRLSYGDRNVDLLRNAGGAVTGTALTRRQLRAQKDDVGDFIYQIEPVWHLGSGPVKQTLLGGFEFRDIAGSTSRTTADLPNTANIFSPVAADGSRAALSFKCDAAHNCDDADLGARFYGLYAMDQIDLGDALKIRLSGRQDWFDTAGTAKSVIAANPGQEIPCTPPRVGVQCPWTPGIPVARRDAPFSFDIGAVYHFLPEVSAFVGYASDSYPIFNTEEPESIGQVPERSRQSEAGLRLDIPNRLTVSTSVYRVTREDVFVVLADALGNDVPSVFSYRVEGWETDINATPVERWTLNANFARQAPRITSFPQTPADIGNKVPSVPTLLANFWTSYDFDVLRVSFGARYRNREFADAGETRLVPGAPLYDAAIAVPRQRWTVSFGVNNLLDRRNFLYGAGTGGGAVPGPGRTEYLRLTAKIW